MRRRAQLRLGLTDERGMIAAWFVVLTMFVFFGFSFFVVNLGNTHEHRRHLQVQVDDGALAAGSYFTGCFQSPIDANKNIAVQALAFSGDPQYTADYAKLFPTGSPPPGPFNQQVEDATRVRVHLNSANYAASLTDTFDPVNGATNGTDFSLGLPCDTRFLDVKATDIDVPTPFGGLVPGTSSNVDVRARARVEIKKVKILTGFLPWAVPDIEPKAVAVIFVDEDDASIKAAQFLNPQFLDANGKPQPQSLNGTALTVWAADVQPTVVPNTGMIVLTSQVANPSLAGTLTEICSQAGVKCTAGSTATSGVDFIHGWPSTSNGIVLRDATLQNVDCTDDSAPYFQWNAGCNFKLQADIDFSGLGGTKTVKAFGTGCPGSGCTMTLNNGLWETGTLSVADGSGRNVYDITAESRVTGGGPPIVTLGTFQDVQHAFAGTDDSSAAGFSNPVQYAAITSGATFANSLQTGVRTVHVSVGLLPPLHVANAGEPPILLRFASKSGSLNQALDCDAAPRNLDDEVREGCKTQYAVNERGGDCSGWTTSNLPPNTFTPNPIPDCIQAKTGDVTAMAHGLHDRFEVPFASSGGCPPNNWNTFRTTNPPTLPPPTDPRWVSLVVTNFSAFSGQGASVVPITKFAGFYVTGWFVGGGMQGTQGCAANDLPPPPLCPTWPVSNGKAGCDPGANGQKGNVWGYFVTEVILNGTGDSNEFCAFNEVGLCFAVLTQ
jgi:hypothetical protein